MPPLDDLAPDALVLEIAADDTFLHVGTIADLFAHVEEPEARTATATATATAESGLLRLVDFFDVSGRPLVPRLDSSLRVVGFRPRRRLAPTQVAERVSRVLDHAQAILEIYPQLGYRGDSMPTATAVPRPQGQLPEIVHSLAEALALRPAVPNRGGWFHNLMHAAGWTHS